MRGRIRTAKPEVLKDEELWDLEVSTGLPLYRAFQGLWFYADREGRFEWRPRALKSDILPYWDGNFDAVLDALARGRFIVRYTVDGREYGWVRTLTRHQRFDHREPPSILPPPPLPGHAEESPGHARVEGNGRELEGNGNGTEGVPVVPGLDVVAGPEPGPDHGQPPVWHDLKGFTPPPELYAEAAMQGITRARFDERFKDLASGPIGGKRGVFDRADYVRRQFPRWRTWTEIQSSPRSSGIRPVSDLDTTSAACAFRPTSAHGMYAAAHGLDLNAAVAKCRGSPRFANLSTAEQEREFLARLKIWRATGALLDPNEPLPRPKPKEARA